MFLEIFLSALLVGFSVILVVTSLLSYLRVRNPRLLLITTSFILFLGESGLLLVGWLALTPLFSYQAPVWLLFLNLAILASLYLAATKG